MQLFSLALQIWSPARNTVFFISILIQIPLLFLPIGIDLMENQVKEAKQMVEESDIKYDEVARKLAMVTFKYGDNSRIE